MGTTLLQPVHPDDLREQLLATIDQLVRLYPAVEDHVSVRSTGRRTLSALVNLDAFSFVNEDYWVGPAPSDEHAAAPACACERCGRCWACAAALDVASCTYAGCGADERNYRPGLKRTVVLVEASIRSAQGIGRVERQRPDGYDGHGVDERIISALLWIRGASLSLAGKHAELAAQVLLELSRVAGHCAGMVEGCGRRFDATWNDCPHCCERAVISDQVDRAFCTNAACRQQDGSRHCWTRQADGAWVEVPELQGRRRRGRDVADGEVANYVAQAEVIKVAIHGVAGQADSVVIAR